MASRSKTLPLLGLLALLLAGAFVLSQIDQGPAKGNGAGLAVPSMGPGPRQAGPEPSDAGSRDTVLSDLPVSEGDFTSTKVIYPLEVEISLIQAGSSALAKDLPPPRSGANARLSGTLMAGDASLGGKLEFLHGPNQGRVLGTDSSGAFGASDLFPGINIVRIETDQGWSSEREILLRSLATTPLNVGFGKGGFAFVQGRVLDPKGEALENAVVRLDGKVGRTDSEGIFAIGRISPGKVMAVVEAPGYARYLEIVPVARATVVQPDQVIFRLEPEAILEVSVAESLGHPGPAELYLFPAGGQRAAHQRAFPWYLVNPIEIFPGTTKRVEGLGAGTLTAMLFRPGAISKPRRSSVRLYPERVNPVELHLEPAPGLRGRVLVEGKPRAGVKVRLEAPNAATATTRLMGLRPTFSEEMILPHLPAGVQELEADRSGRFHFTTWSEIDERYYLTAVTKDGKWRTRRVVQVGDEDLELELEEVVDEPGSIVVAMGGRYQGLPVRVTVQGQPRDPYTLPAGDDLVVDGLTPGLWLVDASWRGKTVSRGSRLNVEPHGRVRLPLVLPLEAIEGQSADQRARAGRE